MTNSFKHSKKAFTVAELIAVCIALGMIAVLVLNGLISSQRDTKKIKFKKAYTMTEKIVSELISDYYYYPYNQDKDKRGFKYTDFKDISGKNMPLPDGGFIDLKGKPRTVELSNRNHKFSYLFASKLHTTAEIKKDGGKLMCTTSDGMIWRIKDTEDFSGDYTEIDVDINGENKGPNKNDADDSIRDRFIIRVYYNGKVTVQPNTLEYDFLYSQSPNNE